VLVTNHNHGRFLSECLRSVQAQTLSDLEIVVVDDGSADESRDVIAELVSEDARIVPILQQNAGQAAALNRAWARARGEVVCFLDSDDFWYPTKVARVVDALAADDSLSLVQHNHDVVDARSERTGRRYPGCRDHPSVLEAIFREGHLGFFSTTSGLACPRRVLERVFPLDPRFRLCADVALCVPLAAFGRVRTLPAALGAYRIHDANHWMGRVGVADRLAQREREIDYANEVLVRLGETRQIDFRASGTYRHLRRLGLPLWHPLRGWAETQKRWWDRQAGRS
jgi:glycosyltransferase involved in cell wall biosynthesis